MPLSNFESDDEGMKAVLVSPAVGGFLLTMMKEGQAFAEAASADFAVSGHYGESFETSLAIEELPAFGDSPAHPAAVATLKNTADYSLDVEYGYHARSGEESATSHSVLRRTRSALHA